MHEIKIIAAAYRFDCPDGAWLEGVLRAVLPFVDQGMGAWAFTFDGREWTRGRLEWAHPTAIGLPSDWVDGLERTLAVATKDERTARQLMFGTPCHTMGAMWAARPQLARSARKAIAIGGVVDSIGVTARDTSGSAVFIGAHAPRVVSLDARRATNLGRIAAHVATALRLRRDLRPTGECSRSELFARAHAVVGPRGAVAHAQDAAASNVNLQSIRRAARLAEAAGRAGSRGDQESALRAWEALVRGRWSLIASYDDGGRRVFVVQPNEPDAPPLHRSLSRRERHVAGCLLLGHSDKLIAYELGVSEGAVASTIHRIRRKLGVASRGPLLSALARLERRCIGEDSDDGTIVARPRTSERPGRQRRA